MAHNDRPAFGEEWGKESGRKTGPAQSIPNTHGRLTHPHNLDWISNLCWFEDSALGVIGK